MSRVSRGLDRVEVIFDDENAVDSAGLLLTATLADRLGLEAAADELVRIPNASLSSGLCEKQVSRLMVVR